MMPIILHRSCSYQSIGYSLQSPNGRASSAPLVQLSGMIYKHPTHDFLKFHLCIHRPTGYGLQPSMRRTSSTTLCSHQSTWYDYNHPRDAFLKFRLRSHRPSRYGLQLSKGCVFFFIVCAVISFLGTVTHLRDTVLRFRLCSHRPTG